MLDKLGRRALLAFVSGAVLCAWSLAGCGGSSEEEPEPPGEDAGLSPDASSPGEDVALPDAAEDAAPEDVSPDVAPPEDVAPLEDVAPDGAPPEDAAEDAAPEDVGEDAEAPEDAGDAADDVAEDAAEDTGPVVECTPGELTGCPADPCAAAVGCSPEGACLYELSGTCAQPDAACGAEVPCLHGTCSPEGQCVGSGDTCDTQADCPNHETCLEGRCDVILELVQSQDFSCALRGDRSAVCWGATALTHPPGTWAQIDVGAKTNPGDEQLCGVRESGAWECFGGTLPAEALLAQPALQVGVGIGFGCVLLTDHTVACWGNNDLNQTASPGGTFDAIRVGGSHSCGLRTDGTVACWGFDAASQVSGPSGSFAQAPSAGSTSSCVLDAEGSVVCWGGINQEPYSAPPGSFAEIQVGETHICARDAAGYVTCWGREIEYEFGEVPARVSSQIFTQLTREESCGLTRGGAIQCWGRIGSGKLPPETTFLQVAASIDASNAGCAIRSDGEARCWGRRVHGSVLRPLTPEGPFTQLTISTLICGLRVDGQALCWRYLGSMDTLPAREDLYAPPFERFTQLYNGTNYTCGIRTNQTLTCWGVNQYGAAIAPPGEFKKLFGFGGQRYTCGLRLDDTVHCWGSVPSYWVALEGAGPFLDASWGCILALDGTPTCAEDIPSTPAESGFVEVENTSTFACARRADGTITCWGRSYNSSGAPPPLSPPGRFLQLDASPDSMCGVLESGRILCWKAAIINSN